MFDRNAHLRNYGKTMNIESENDSNTDDDEDEDTNNQLIA